MHVNMPGLLYQAVIATSAILFIGCADQSSEPIEAESTITMRAAVKGAPQSQNGDTDYCDGSILCESGEGDCDSDAQCAFGLVCAEDVGPRFGLGRKWDVCLKPFCIDGLLSGDETGVDCGGSCGSCPPPPSSCSDGQLNGSETAIDCGGGTCQGCGNALTCSVNADCQSGFCDGNVCKEAPSCNDSVQNQAETGIDCGGPCQACPAPYTGGFGWIVTENNKATIPPELQPGVQIVLGEDITVGTKTDWKETRLVGASWNLAGKKVSGGGVASSELELPAYTVVSNGTIENVTIDSPGPLLFINCTFTGEVLLDNNTTIIGGTLTQGLLEGMFTNSDIHIERMEIRNSTILKANRLIHSEVDSSYLESIDLISHNAFDDVGLFDFETLDGNIIEDSQLVSSCDTKRISNNIIDQAKGSYSIETNHVSSSGSACLPFDGVMVTGNRFLANSSKPSTAFIRLATDTRDATNSRASFIIQGNNFSCRTSSQRAVDGSTGMRVVMSHNTLSNHCSDNLNNPTHSRTATDHGFNLRTSL